MHSATSKKPFIIFDFDNTLFDTGSFKRAIDDIFLRERVTSENLIAAHEKARAQARHRWMFNSISFCASRIPPVRRERIYRQIDLLLLNTKPFVFADSVYALNRLKEMGCTFALITSGDRETQLAKVRSSGIAHFFVSPMVSRTPDKTRELEHLLGKGKSAKKTFFVEDNPFALQAAKKRYSDITTVRMRRGGGIYDSTSLSEGIDHELKNMRGFERVVRDYTKSPRFFPGTFFSS